MAGTYKPKIKVICPNCRWKGERAVIAKACPKCSFWYPQKIQTPAEWEADVMVRNPTAHRKAVVYSTAWAIIFGLVEVPTEPAQEHQTTPAQTALSQ